MDTEQQSYKRFFYQSWLELETEFQKGNINPQHENDVVCYLYHALAKRFKKKGFPLHFIRTEDTRACKDGQMRPDLNLNDRVFVEVKMYSLRNYRQGWKRRQEGIKYTVDKLKQYVAHQKSNSSAKVRYPILAIWFRKRRTKKRVCQTLQYTRLLYHKRFGRETSKKRSDIVRAPHYSMDRENIR